MKNESETKLKPKYPLQPGSEEFKKMHPHPLRTAWCYLVVGMVGIALAKYNIIPNELGYVIALICSFLGLPSIVAAFRSM